MTIASPDGRLIREALAEKMLWLYTVGIYQAASLPNKTVNVPLIESRLLHWLNYRYRLAGYLHFACDGLFFAHGRASKDGTITVVIQKGENKKQLNRHFRLQFDLESLYRALPSRTPRAK